ncbi:hypothetical protein [Mycetocola miduiensis]|uniref:Antitoxin Xre/MbcA/ParS-like toxin-binding domain-containing protein n=1 Tax=Mycetocola miduiensis TaxID=995034 RepID=A0A1I4YZD6_9MICO|nr:hypothetical protein [Mycetocola miduiensis]SFN43381.1 hypothetical protein SAMN05216219_0626 [Mycetocola miduiensis]
MTDSTPSPDNADGLIGTPVSDEAVRRLADAIAHLAADGPYLVDAVTEFALTLRPVSRDGRLSKQQEEFLIESGSFTAEELADAKRDVDKGSLQLGAIDAFLSNLCATMSLEDAAGFLGWDEGAVTTAVSEGRLYGVEISGRLRFPSWQFNLGSPDKLLPGLAEVIKVLTPRWGWHSVAGFMSTPQEDLVAKGRKTPAVFLRDGGDVSEVRAIVESDDWW